MQGFPDELLKRKENAQVLTEGEERRGEEKNRERRGGERGKARVRGEGAGRERSRWGFCLYCNFFESDNHHVRDAVAESFAGAEE